jgi:hypothetical protein
VIDLRYGRCTMEKSGKTAPKPHRTAAEIREERLKAALKANMARRKAQTKERARISATDTDNKNA